MANKKKYHVFLLSKFETSTTEKRCGKIRCTQCVDTIDDAVYKIFRTFLLLKKLNAMKHDDFLRDLHTGNIIKEIAKQKGISSNEIAIVMNRYQRNTCRVFKLKDMDIEDIVQISYLLEYNILNFIVQKYLSHLPNNSKLPYSESYFLRIDMRTQRVTTSEVFNNCNFLKDIYIGQHIRKISQKMGWHGKEMAKQLQCSQGAISHLYNSKSLKLKTLIRISEVLQYNFIAELYLSQMAIAPSLDKFDDCIISLNQHEIRILNAIDKSILMIFQRNDDKKKEV